MVYRIPAVNLVGRGCLAQLKDEIGTLGCKKALVVSDKFLTENGVVEKVTKVLDQVGIEHTLYNDVKQNPSVANEGTEKVDYTVYIWYNVSIKYRRCFYDRTTAEIDAKSIHGNI